LAEKDTILFQNRQKFNKTAEDAEDAEDAEGAEEYRSLLTPKGVERIIAPGETRGRRTPTVPGTPKGFN